MTLHIAKRLKAASFAAVVLAIGLVHFRRVALRKSVRRLAHHGVLRPYASGRERLSIPAFQNEHFSWKWLSWTKRVSPNGTYGISARDCSRQSDLAPENFTALAHFSVSSAMSLPKSAGEPGSGTPKSASRAFIFGSTRAALISLLSLSTIAESVLLGAPT